MANRPTKHHRKIINTKEIMKRKIYLSITIVSFIIGLSLLLSNNDYWISAFVVGIYFIFKNPNT